MTVHAVTARGERHGTEVYGLYALMVWMSGSKMGRTISERDRRRVARAVLERERNVFHKGVDDLYVQRYLTNLGIEVIDHDRTTLGSIIYEKGTLLSDHRNIDPKDLEREGKTLGHWETEFIEDNMGTRQCAYFVGSKMHGKSSTVLFGPPLRRGLHYVEADCDCVLGVITRRTDDVDALDLKGMVGTHVGSCAFHPDGDLYLEGKWQSITGYNFFGLDRHDFPRHVGILVDADEGIARYVIRGVVQPYVISNLGSITFFAFGDSSTDHGRVRGLRFEEMVVAEKGVLEEEEEDKRFHAAMSLSKS